MNPRLAGVRPLALALILLGADLAAGLGAFDLPWIDEPDQINHVEAIERAWQGGGEQVLFADDFSIGTANWLKDHGLAGMHGGARPEARDGPAKWAQDLYRWGSAGLGTPMSGWTPTDGAYRFGSDAGYPSKTHAELVSPVIDLRPLAALPESTVRASANEDPIGPPTDDCPPKIAILGVYPIASWCLARETYNNATAGTFEDGRHSQETPRAASAALVLRHEYDWRAGPEGNIDGGRVVVSAFDEIAQAWLPWEPLLPTDSALQLGEHQIRVRTNASQPLAARLTFPDAKAGHAGHATIQVGGQEIVLDDSGPRVGPANGIRPHLYQGNIAAGGWHGFGGTSNGPVTSVFDLSRHAGHLVRLAFETSTATLPRKAPLVTDHAGWSLDEVQVQGAGPGAIRILGLLSPGPGVAIPPGARLEPSFVVQNTARHSVDIALDADLDGEVGSARGRISVGPLGRIAVGDLGIDRRIESADGLHLLKASVRQVAVPGVPAQAPGVPSHQSTFHFVSAAFSHWAPVETEFRPLVGKPGALKEASGRFLEVGQTAIVRVTLENMGTLPIQVRLGDSATSALVRGDLRPALVDESGQEHGRLKPDEPVVDLPVSRSVSGDVGHPSAARTVVWTWSGSETARVLRLQLLVPDSEAATGERILADLGEVAVSTVASPPIDVDVSNLWTLSAGASACQRVSERDGQVGVVTCPGPSTILSPSRRLLEIDLLRGTNVSLVISHRGSLQAALQLTRAAAPDALPEPNAAWDTVATSVLPAPAGWRTQNVPLGTLPSDFSGHVRLQLASEGAFDVDAVGAYLDLANSEGIHVSVPVVADRFDITFEPARAVVEATEPSGLAVLDGLDATAAGQTRFLEDSILELEQPLNLSAWGRPKLHMRHWLDSGFHGHASIEVARDLQPVEWHPVAAFRGTDAGFDTRHIEVDLGRYAGETIRLRWRLHHDATILTAEPAGGQVTGGPGSVTADRSLTPSADARPAGWVLEGVSITAWGHQGPTILHEAPEDFGGYGFVGGHPAQSFTAATGNCWAGLELDGECRTGRGVSSLVTSGFTVANMLHPVLRLGHEGTLSGTSCGGYTSFPAVDLDYQALAGGVPDGPWVAATPTEGVVPSPQGTVRGWKRVAGGLADPDASGLRDAPFGGNHLNVAHVGENAGRNGCVAPDSQPLATAFPIEAREDVFDLSPLISLDGGIRVRLDAWVERAKGPRSGASVITPFGDYNVTSLRIAEHRQFVDLGITGITTSQDDLQRLQALDPTVATRAGLAGNIILAQDLAEFTVAVQNFGQLAAKGDISLRAVREGATGQDQAIDIRWMKPQGDHFVPSQKPTGSIQLEPAALSFDGTAPDKGTVVFRANFLEAPPGTYRITARADATSGVDTAAINDILERTIVILPFRSLNAEGAGAMVRPFAAEATASRIVQATIANDGNVDENAVMARADLVQMTGLNEFVPLGVELQAVGGDVLALERRGSGREQVRWSLGPEDLPPEVMPEDFLTAGKSYAVRVRPSPHSGSVTQWWATAPQAPLEEGTNSGQLLNLSRAKNPCACLLIPFLVERVLYETDLSPQNSTSVLDTILPIATRQDLIEGWTAQTTLDGAPLNDGSRPDIPRWTLVDTSTTQDLFDGEPTGEDWFLPKYTGLENVEHTLTTPVLPAHVIDEGSRSVLALPYASNIAPGQAVLETRRLVGGEWTAWQPADALRAGRVAIILAYDFPLVEPTGTGSGLLDRSDLILSGPGHGTLQATNTQIALRPGGPGRLCFVDRDNNGKFEVGDDAFAAHDCSAVRVGDVPITGATRGIPVTSGSSTLGQPLRPAGGFGWLQCYSEFEPGAGENRNRLSRTDCILADMDGSGTASQGDVSMTTVDARAPQNTPIQLDAGEILAANTALTGQILEAGSAHPAYRDADGDGLYGPQDGLVWFDPDLDFARMYDQDSLANAGLPAPPVGPEADGRVSVGAMGPDDHAASCRSAGDLCGWGPTPTYATAGNEAWIDALNETLLLLSAALGPDNVALFTTLDGNGDFGLGTLDNGILVLNVQTPTGTRRFPIRDLDHLGLEMDRYGAILLVGNGVTGPFAAEAPSVRALDWDSVSAPSPMAVQHEAGTAAILQAAHSAGIGVFGTLGPASATLVRSNAVGQPGLAVWQARQMMPDEIGPSDRQGSKAGLFCLATKPDGPASERWEPPSPADAQPLKPCRKQDPGQVGGVEALTDPHNYYWVSPEDQQSLTLRDWVENPAIAFKGANVPGANIKQCPGEHPLLASSGRPIIPCTVYAGTTTSQVQDGPRIVSGAGPKDVPAWVAGILDQLTADGSLPAGPWQDLPASLAFPFGGAFQRRNDGSDYFDGAPAQARIVVRANEASGGHGAMAIDGVGLLGTNRSQGLGIAIVRPHDQEAFLPGGRFQILIEVSNRGTSATPATNATVVMARWVRPGDCAVAAPPAALVEIPALAAGAYTVMEVPINGGFFPSSEACPPAPLQQNLYNITAGLDVGRLDDDSLDDVAEVVVLGREVIQMDSSTIGGFAVNPPALVLGDNGDVTVSAHIVNRGSGTQTISMKVDVVPARPTPCLQSISGTGAKEVHACDGAQRSQAVELPQSSALTTLQRGESGTTTLTINPSDLGMQPGVYRVRARWSASDSAEQVHRYPSADQPPVEALLRVLADADPETARELLAPDGAYAFLGETFDGPMTGVTISGAGTNGGGYGPDDTTMGDPDPEDTDSAEVPLSHGWQFAQCSDDADSTRSCMQWSREGTPSFREGIDPEVVTDDSATYYDDVGQGDFGPDTLTWQPIALADPTKPQVPYLSLASYQSPTLNFLTSFRGTPNTAFVVEMELARRTPCGRAGNGAVDCTSSTWEWESTKSGLVFPIAPPGTPAPPDYGQGNDGQESHQGTIGGSGGRPPQATQIRQVPSNPLATELGFWGATSGQHAEDGGWMRVQIPIDTADERLRDYCIAVARDDPVPGNQETLHLTEADPCKLAHVTANGQDNSIETYVARPVRFHLRAASYGGDVGTSVWSVADLSLGDHDPQLGGTGHRSISMQDAEERVFPLRVKNDGAVPDRMHVSWEPTRAGAPKLGAGGGIALAFDQTFAEASRSLEVDLAPGASRVVWVRLTTGILENVPAGQSQRIPFLIQARSTVEGIQVAETLVDAKFTVRSWPDLEARSLVLGNDAGKGLHEASVGNHVKATAKFRNSGKIAFGTTGQELDARLVATQIDETTGLAVGPPHEVATTAIDLPIAPFSQDPRDHFVSFAEWRPNATGLYILSATLNQAGTFPESEYGDNSASRLVQVGPVRFADLRIKRLWLTEFTLQCGSDPVQRAVDGHQYCINAEVENHGRAPALDPRIDFSIGASAPFSAGAPTLEDLVDGLFPPASSSGEPTTVIVVSSPRGIRMPSSGNELLLRAELSARSIMPNFDGKVAELSVPIDSFRLAVDAVKDPVLLAPGHEARVPLLLTNRGTAPTTPWLVDANATEVLGVSLSGARTLLPGEQTIVHLVLQAAPGLQQGTRVGPVILGALEDSLSRIQVPLTLDVAGNKVPSAGSLPGPASLATANNLTLVLDASRSPLSFRWTIADAPGLRIAADWNITTVPFDRVVVDIPAQVLPSVPPGPTALPIKLAAQAGASTLLIPVNATLDVARQPSIAASIETPYLIAGPGTPAIVRIFLNNTGNVPLHGIIEHTIEDGEVPDDQSFIIEPGQGLALDAPVTAGQFNRSAGSSTVHWGPADSARDAKTLDWIVTATPARVRIEGDLEAGSPVAGRQASMTVTVRNEEPQPVVAEVLLAIDGVVRDARTVQLAGGQSRAVTLSFVSGRAGEHMEATVLVRPAGSTAQFGERQLEIVGDAETLDLMPRGERSSPIPAPLAAWLAVALFIIAWRRRQ